MQVSAAELVRLVGDPAEATLQAINRDAVTFIGDAPVALPINQLVRWGHPAEPRPQIIVLLADGGRLVTAPAWSGGAPIRLDGEDVVVLTDTWGEARLSRNFVRGFVFAQRQHSREREKLQQVIGAADFESDTVFLTNRDRISGRMAALAGGALTLETEVGPAKLPLSRVDAIVLSGKETTGAADRGELNSTNLSVEDSPALRSQLPLLAVGTADGSLVYAGAVTADTTEFTVEAAGGFRLEGGNIGDLVLLQSLAGRIVYLSDLEPEGYRHVPYLSIEWPFQKDRNVLGGPLSVGGERYLKGIGMHSAARLTYRLDGQFRRFDSAIAIDDSANGRGSVTFGVYLLREGKWQEAFTSDIVRGGEAPRSESVDVAGADGLTLTVDYADRGDEMDRAVWLDARLVKN